MMQLSPIAPVARVSTFDSAVTARSIAPAAHELAPAAPTSTLAVQGAIDGIARLVAGPIVDLPGIAVGDTFDIVKGSKVGSFGVTGEAELLRLDPDHVSFHLKAGKFGFKVDVTVDVVQTGPDTVRISSTGSGVPNTTADGRVITSRPNFAEFERIDAPDEHTIIQHDGAGKLAIDTVVPRFGDAHLLLERR